MRRTHAFKPRRRPHVQPTMEELEAMIERLPKYIVGAAGTRIPLMEATIDDLNAYIARIKETTEREQSI